MMAKKAKVELTLEELQAKKSKKQRGWVRFAAILLAVVLTLGVYFGASNGGPNIVEVYPNIVRAQTKTVVQKQDAAPTDTDSSDDANTQTPTTPAEEEGSILETLMGLLGGLDLSGLAGKVDLSGLGITIADGIQTAKDSLLTLIDQLEASITGKPVIVHDQVEHDFDASVDTGDALLRQLLVDKLNAATQAGVGYTLTRTAQFTDDGHVNIGEPTETVNKILEPAGLSLDRIVGQFAGMQSNEQFGEPISYTVEKGKTAKDVVEENEMDAVYENYGLMPTQLQADDIALVEANIISGRYVFVLKNVDNPNRGVGCGLNRFTKDFLVQHEIATRIKNVNVGTETATTPLKLTDLETKYYNIRVTVQFNQVTGCLTQLNYTYETYSKFTVRTNTVQVVGCDTIQVDNTYTNFVY